MRSISKKGQLDTLGPTVLALIFAAIILVFGLIISQELRDVEVVSVVDGVEANETGGSITSSGYTLESSTAPAFASPSISAIVNATDGTTVSTGNYTLTGNVVYNATVWNWGDVNIAYTYTRGGEAYDAANQTIVGLGTFADFWEIIILAVIITIVIGLLLMTFGREGKR